MKYKLIIAALPWEGQSCTATVLTEAEKPVEFYLERADAAPILGNIYVGKVEKIQQNLQAAFVRFEKDRLGYLPLSDLDGIVTKTRKQTETLRVGDELLVQVEREAIKQKQPGLTVNLTLTGRYLVLSSGVRRLNLSRKLPADEKKRLRKLLPWTEEAGFGLIVRTGAAEAEEPELLGEYARLKEKFLRLVTTGVSRTCYSCLYQENRDWVRLIRQCPIRDLSVVTDLPAYAEQAKELLAEEHADAAAQVRCYEDAMLPLYKLYRLETLLESLQKERVWLNSGGFLVIQQTEACVVIDVNTGKYTGKHSAQETFRAINREAASEIARQIRLRQLSGILLIDFINMDSEQWKKELMQELQMLVLRDHVKTRVVDLTKLQITEMTRHKERKSLREQLEEIRS